MAEKQEKTNKEENVFLFAVEYVTQRLRYQPASELRLENYKKCCESGRLLRCAAGLGVFGLSFVLSRRLEVDIVRRHLFSLSLGFIAFIQLDERKTRSCCKSLIVTPDIPMAQDLRDILRRNAPKHSLLSHFESQFPSQATEEQHEFDNNPKAGVIEILQAELKTLEKERKKATKKGVVDAVEDTSQKQPTRSSTSSPSSAHTIGWGTSDDDSDNIPTPVMFDDEDSKASPSSSSSPSFGVEHDDSSDRNEERRSRRKENSERRRRRKRDDDDE
eukprot:TRINITY_DN2660_c0_g1_i1.p1 TRINITY_DN2660_c0_g1~~TRINITY_DN2660_c0_g1_i1.p1  ORF type:complete len:302 (-),score=69.90 TRINITY_DN2660_c0_g1_i1:79-900(-)